MLHKQKKHAHELEDYNERENTRILYAQMCKHGIRLSTSPIAQLFRIEGLYAKTLDFSSLVRSAQSACVGECHFSCAHVHPSTHPSRHTIVYLSHSFYPWHAFENFRSVRFRGSSESSFATVMACTIIPDGCSRAVIKEITLQESNSIHNIFSRISVYGSQSTRIHGKGSQMVYSQ